MGDIFVDLAGFKLNTRDGKVELGLVCRFCTELDFI